MANVLILMYYSHYGVVDLPDFQYHSLTDNLYDVNPSSLIIQIVQH